MPFRFSLAPGQPIVDQVVFAATKAFVRGEMQPGDPFPSVRALAAQLKINPNTAAKAVQHLVQEGWLEVRPGLGTVVATPRKPKATEQRKLLAEDVEQLVVKARGLGLSRTDVDEAVAAHWKSLDEAGNE